MTNSLLTPDVFANEAIMHLENELVLGNMVNSDYSKEFTAVGETISIRKPVRFAGQSDNLDVTSYNEDIIEGKQTVTMDKTETIKFSLTALDRTLSVEKISERYIKPAVDKLRDRIEAEIASNYYKFFHFGGTPGTTPSTFLSLASAGAVLTDQAVPTSRRFAVHGPDTAVALADGLKGVYVQDKAKTAFEEAKIGRYGMFDNYMSVHAPTHVVGAHGGTPLVNGADQNVTYAASKNGWSQTLVTNGWTNSTTGILKAGDVITIAGVYAVNPVSRTSTGRLQTFTVLADADSGASTGPATITISPAIIVSGAYQTVSAAPADDAVITVKTGTASASNRQSLLMHPDAITLVTRPLDIASGAGLKTSTKSGNRVTISCSEWIDGNTLTHNFRFDMLFKAECIDPRLGYRLTA